MVKNIIELVPEDDLELLRLYYLVSHLPDGQRILIDLSDAPVTPQFPEAVVYRFARKRGRKYEKSNYSQ